MNSPFSWNEINKMTIVFIRLFWKTERLLLAVLNLLNPKWHSRKSNGVQHGCNEQLLRFYWKVLKLLLRVLRGYYKTWGLKKWWITKTRCGCHWDQGYWNATEMIIILLYYKDLDWFWKLCHSWIVILFIKKFMLPKENKIII